MDWIDSYQPKFWISTFQRHLLFDWCANTLGWYIRAADWPQLQLQNDLSYLGFPKLWLKFEHTLCSWHTNTVLCYSSMEKHELFFASGEAKENWIHTYKSILNKIRNVSGRTVTTSNRRKLYRRWATRTSVHTKYQRLYSIYTLLRSLSVLLFQKSSSRSRIIPVELNVESTSGC